MYLILFLKRYSIVSLHSTALKRRLLTNYIFFKVTRLKSTKYKNSKEIEPGY